MYEAAPLQLGQYPNDALSATRMRNDFRRRIKKIKSQQQQLLRLQRKQNWKVARQREKLAKARLHCMQS